LPSDLAPQNPDLPFGKTNYIDLTDYSSHLFTSGHRNQLGLAFLDDGRLLESDNGPRGGDALNFLTQGKNYGWPYESYGTRYSSFSAYADGLVVPAGGTYEPPMYVFTPSIAPTQLVQIERFDPKWDGNVLLGSLAAQSLYNIKIVGSRVVYCEPIRIGARIRELRQFDDSFVLLTDTGSLIEVRKASGQTTPFVLPK
jgi:glucose/arabinose dehydrogenase